MKKSIKKLLPGLLPLLCIPFLWNPMIAKGEVRESIIGNEHHEMHRENDVMKILAVLEKKIQDQKLLDRAKVKLLTLKDSEFDLITSLSEQIVKEGETPGVDIAFLLVTALIILS
jgi:hypothetical protein